MEFLKEKAGYIWGRISNEDGIQHVEEALLLGLIAVVSILVTTSLGQNVTTVFGIADTAMADAATP